MPCLPKKSKPQQGKTGRVGMGSQGRIKGRRCLIGNKPGRNRPAGRYSLLNLAQAVGNLLNSGGADDVLRIG
jgi:hypothetical protein